MKYPDPVELSCRLMAADTRNPPGNQQCAVDILKDELTNLGIPYFVDFVDGAPSVFAELEFSRSGPSVCWLGHWDVVPPGPESSWTATQPFEPIINNGMLYGRGACDMKTALAAALCAAADLNADSKHLNGRLILAFLADEEDGGARGAVPLLPKLHNRYQINFGIVGEPTGFEIKIARRGVCVGKVTFKGIQAHAARPDEGDNPIIKMAKGIIAFETLTMTYDDDDLLGRPTLSITSVRGGERDNVIPECAVIGMDIRVTPSQTLESVTRDLKTALDSQGLTVPTDYELDMHWLANPYKTSDPAYIDICRSELESILGYQPALSGRGGTSDGRVLAALGVPVLEFGLENTTLHKVNECCPVDSIHRLRECYRALFQRLLRS